MAKTSINSQDIRDLNVQTADLANDSVTKDKLGILTTKGDVIAFSTEPDRVAVGTNGQVLTANSAATFGLEWATLVALATADVDEETPTGTINSANDTFTISRAPAALILLFKNGIFQRPGTGNDYVRTAASIVYEAGNIPQTGDSHYAILVGA